MGVWAASREHGPFFCGRLNAWVISPGAEIRNVFTDPDTFRNSGMARPFNPPPRDVADILAQVPTPDERDILLSDFPRHERLRKVFRQGFQVKGAEVRRGLALRLFGVNLFPKAGLCDGDVEPRLRESRP